ncbi:NAD(P)-dependent oxidoreductase [Nocardia asteroides]|uniref:NAD(P)-dependent oxidoreductase n=1 Tax=Nocardia asteroides TaxID=1824 RepID=UPI001E4F88D9|nr:NAD(P)-dependent oxidoreductase [Nocardia asteroides]UGT62544.1 NAD(P)-dependent oxidoreductase [Nocardia asteroides]
MSLNVGFVGAGRMGGVMVRRLLDAGHRVRVFARRDEVRERLRGWGAELAATPAEVAAGADTVITCLFSDDQLIEVLGGADGVLAAAGPGVPVVSHSTGTVATVTGLAAAHPGAGVLLDGPVSGTADDIAAGRLTVLLGGPEETVARALPVLTAYGDPVITTGALGTALSVKLVNNALFAANAQLVAAAVAVGEQLGTSGEQLLAALARCSGDSYAAKAVRTTGGLPAFATIAAPFLRKDVAACLSAAGDLGVDLGRLAEVIRTGPLELA